MKCRDVLKQLSLFLDEMLEADIAVKVSVHLGWCSECRRELERLAVLRSKLGSLGKVTAPEYLWHLVQLRLANAQQRSWRIRFQEALQYRWSKIRTTEGMWYLTRMVGTATTFVFFFALYSAMNPIGIDFRADISERGGLSPNLRQQLANNVLKNLGLMPLEAQRKPISSSDPKINDLYLLNFGESASRRGADDTFSVVTVVDRSGSAKIRNVLEYPSDTALFYNFSNMVTSARYRPASQDGRAIDAYLVLSFSKISVYD